MIPAGRGGESARGQVGRDEDAGAPVLPQVEEQRGIAHVESREATVGRGADAMPGIDESPVVGEDRRIIGELRRDVDLGC